MFATFSCIYGQHSFSIVNAPCSHANINQRMIVRLLLSCSHHRLLVIFVRLVIRRLDRKSNLIISVFSIRAPDPGSQGLLERSSSKNLHQSFIWGHLAFVILQWLRNMLLFLDRSIPSPRSKLRGVGTADMSNLEWRLFLTHMLLRERDWMNTTINVERPFCFRTKGQQELTMALRVCQCL